MDNSQKITKSKNRAGSLILSAALICLVLLCWHSQVQAQSGRTTVSPAAFKALHEAREMLEENRLGEADEKLLQIINRFSSDADTLVSAWQMRGYLLSETGRHREAFEAFEQALAHDGLEDSLRSQLLYNSAQLLILLKRYNEALERIQNWTGLVEELTPDQHARVAWIHYGAESYQGAVNHMRTAIQNVDQPRDSWMEMLVAAMHHSEDYPGLKEWLPILIEQRPGEKRYWEHLAGVHMQLGNDQEAAAVLSAGYHNGVFVDSSDIIRLVQLYRQAGVPGKAARTLQVALEQGQIPDKPCNYKILADTWLQANELRLAATALEHKVARQNDCDSRLRLGRLFLQMEDWNSAEKHLQEASNGQCSKTARHAQFMLGIAEYHQGRIDKARTAFTQAGNDPEFRTQVRGWLKYLEQS